jgi:hypothetical protein
VAAVSVGGLTATFQSRQTVGGIDTVTFRVAGTAAASGTWFINFETGTQIVATGSSVWAAQLFHRLDAAPNPPVSHQLHIQGRTSAGVASGAIVQADITPTGSLARATLAGAIGASAQRVTSAYQATVSNGLAYDWTITMGWPGLELGAFASTPILPPAASPAATTRGRDIASATLTGLGLAATGAGTILFAGVLPQAAPAGSNQTLFQIDDGTDNNRIVVRNLAGGSDVEVAAVLAGTPTTAALGTMVAGTRFRLAISPDGAGNVVFSWNGGAAGTVAGAPTSGLTTLRLGDNASGTLSMFGEADTLTTLTAATAAAALPALVPAA